VIVRVAIEHIAVVVGRISHQFDIDAVLLKEVHRLQRFGLFEATIVRSCRVNISLFASTLLEASEDQDFTRGDLEGTHIELSLGELELEHLPAVLALAQPLNRRRWLQLARTLLGEPTDAVKGRPIVEEAQRGVELRLTQLRQALPHVLSYNVALAVLRCLVVIHFAASNENLREVRVDSQAESRARDPHAGSFFKLVVNELVSGFDWLGTVDISRATHDESASVG